VILQLRGSTGSVGKLTLQRDCVLRRDFSQWQCLGGRPAGGATMNLPEAGSAGMLPCRGIIWRAHRADSLAAREAFSPRGTIKLEEGSHRTIDPHALKIPAPQGRNLP